MANKTTYHRTQHGETTSFGMDSNECQGCALYKYFVIYAIYWVQNNALAGYSGVEDRRSCLVSDLACADPAVN